MLYVGLDTAALFFRENSFEKGSQLSWVWMFFMQLIHDATTITESRPVAERGPAAE